MVLETAHERWISEDLHYSSNTARDECLRINLYLSTVFHTCKGVAARARLATCGCGLKIRYPVM